ncbi:MAG: FAD-dependent oxidoreductase, partial [Parvularculaceae bacterium]
MKSDTIIIGGGLAGAAALFELARRGVAATLLEAREGVALETSFANGGMMTPSMPEPWNGPGVGRHLFESLFDPASPMKLRPRAIPGLAFWGLRFLGNSAPARHRAAAAANYALASYSARTTHAWREAYALDYDAAQTGSLKIFEKREAMTEQLDAAERLAPLGLRVEIADTDRAIEIEPELAEIRGQIACALYYPDDGIGDAHKFVRSLADQSLKLGASIRTGARAIAIKSHGGQVTGVMTDGGFLEATRVVIAAGNASPALARAVGVSLPIKPVKGYSLTYEVAGKNRRPRVAVIDEAMHAAMVPIGDRLRAVGTAEFTGFDLSLRPERIDNLRRFFERIYPSLSREIEARAGEPWTGLRPMSADGMPFIGEARIRGLWINAGHGHLGWTMAAGSAALLA